METCLRWDTARPERPVFERFVSGVIDAGYSFDRQVLIAADYGVPSAAPAAVLRWRTGRSSRQHPPSGLVHGVANANALRTARDWYLARRESAPASHGGGSPIRPSRRPESSRARGGRDRDVRGGACGDSAGRQASLFWTEKRGHPTPRFKWRSRYWTFLLKLAPDRPSPTIQGQPGPCDPPCHWENRRLRVAELKRLMGFPDHFRILGSRRAQQLQLGNAVQAELGNLSHTALLSCIVSAQRTLLRRSLLDAPPLYR